MDYRFIFANNTVPESCCNKSIENEFLCDGERLNVTDNADGVIYNQVSVMLYAVITVTPHWSVLIKFLSALITPHWKVLRS